MYAAEAKELLQQVPKENFIMKYYSNEIDSCCAIGHLKRLTSENPENYRIENCWDSIGEHDGDEVYLFARKTVRAYIEKFHGEQGYDLSSVNNSTKVNGYTEPEIKDRVIHLLDDMIEAGY